jgi:hypothetical protein
MIQDIEPEWQKVKEYEAEAVRGMFEYLRPSFQYLLAHTLQS